MEPKISSSAEEVKNLSWDDLNYAFALSYASEIRAAVDHGGDAALRSELETWEPKVHAMFARALAEVA